MNEYNKPKIVQKGPVPSMGSEKILPVIWYFPVARNSGYEKTSFINMLSGSSL